MEKELFSYEADGTALIIHLPGEVDHHNCITLKYETDLLLEENYINRIVFDFTSTEFMDSSGIGGTVKIFWQTGLSSASAPSVRSRPEETSVTTAVRYWNRKIYKTQFVQCAAGQ